MDKAKKNLSLEERKNATVNDQNIRNPQEQQNAKRNNNNADLAFALSLIGGLLIVIGSALGMSWIFTGYPLYGGGMMGGYGGGMMGGGYYGNMMYGGGFGFVAVIGLVAGIVILVSAFLLRARPQSDRKTFGTLILVFSIVSLIGLGGFVIGAVLGIIGGILALT